MAELKTFQELFCSHLKDSISETSNDVSFQIREVKEIGDFAYNLDHIKDRLVGLDRLLVNLILANIKANPGIKLDDKLPDTLIQNMVAVISKNNSREQSKVKTLLQNTNILPPDIIIDGDKLIFLWNIFIMQHDYSFDQALNRFKEVISGTECGYGPQDVEMFINYAMELNMISPNQEAFTLERPVKKDGVVIEDKSLEEKKDD